MAPDLYVSDVSVSDENPVTDDVVKIQVTVQIQGERRATPTTIRFYRSSDSTIGTSDQEPGNEAVAARSVSATRSRTLDVTVPSAPATFYLGVGSRQRF